MIAPMRPVVYVVCSRDGKVLAERRSMSPLSHAAVALRRDGRVEVVAWGSRGEVAEYLERELGRRPYELRGGVIASTHVQRRPLR